MILTIDTEKESSARLRQIALFLEQLAGDAPASEMPVETSSEMFSMFGGDDSDDEPAKPAKPFSVQPY